MILLRIEDEKPSEGEAPITADERNWKALERQDWHLWVLALLLLLTLGGSLLAFMFPAAFWVQGEGTESARRAFFGYCLLLALALVYMVQRQKIVRRLRRSLYEAQAAAVAAQRQANIRAFQALPEIDQFRDSLAMEFLRASRSNGHLAVLLLFTAGAGLERLGRISALTRDVLHPGEPLFRISERVLAAILPGTAPAAAAALEQSARDRLKTLPAGPPVSLVSLTYPEQVATVSEIEKIVRNVVGGAGEPEVRAAVGIESLTH